MLTRHVSFSNHFSQLDFINTKVNNIKVYFRPMARIPYSFLGPKRLCSLINGDLKRVLCGFFPAFSSGTLLCVWEPLTVEKILRVRYARAHSSAAFLS